MVHAPSQVLQKCPAGSIRKVEWKGINGIVLVDLPDGLTYITGIPGAALPLCVSAFEAFNLDLHVEIGNIRRNADGTRSADYAGRIEVVISAESVVPVFESGEEGET